MAKRMTPGEYKQMTEAKIAAISAAFEAEVTMQCDGDEELKIWLRRQTLEKLVNRGKN